MTWFLTANQTVKAQTCGSSIVLDVYECNWDTGLGKCEAFRVGQYAYNCRSSPCETYMAVCSSNDIDKCIGTKSTCRFYPACSRSPCYEDGGGETCGGISSCSSKSCSGNATCRSAEGSCKCITVPPAPTPVPNRPPVCGAITGSTSICRGQTYPYTSSCSDPDFNLAQVDFAWAPVTTGGWTAMGSCNPTNGDCTQDLFVDPAKFAVGSNYYVVNGAADSGSPALKCSAKKGPSALIGQHLRLSAVCPFINQENHFGLPPSPSII